MKVGTPVALMAEREDQVSSVDGYKPPDDVYKEGSEVRTLTWQSYLKSDEGDDTKGCS